MYCPGCSAFLHQRAVMKHNLLVQLGNWICSSLEKPAGTTTPILSVLVRPVSLAQRALVEALARACVCRVSADAQWDKAQEERKLDFPFFLLLGISLLTKVVLANLYSCSGTVVYYTYIFTSPILIHAVHVSYLTDPSATRATSLCLAINETSLLRISWSDERHSFFFSLAG